jgi:adenosylcobalamin-dependent ribonucleoside-triphosphate reductase
MQIKKRNGQMVEFDKQRIVNAVLGAMGDVGLNLVDDAQRVADTIEIKLNYSDAEITVENVQDMVELELMRAFPEVAKVYILYRNDRNITRNNTTKTNYKFLSDSFLNKYKKLTPPFTELGQFVYLRTYSRWLADKGRREYWWETVARAVSHNCSLLPTTVEEAEKLYDNVFNLRQFLSGRSLWSGGSSATVASPMSNFNCATIVMNDLDNFRDMLYALLVGTGVGFRVLKSDVIKMSKVRGDINVIHEHYQPVEKHKRFESTCLNFIGDVAEIKVGDSKAGWVQALDYLIKLHYAHEYKYIKNIIINYNSVRPAGERLKTFGGTASGALPLIEMFEKISKILKKDNNGFKKLKPIDVMDISNILASGVVVGGVRRSAQICLVDSEDSEIIQAKSNLYTQDEQGNWSINKEISHRQLSNNSIAYFSKPTREKLNWQMQQMRYNGEPAFYNYEAGLKRRDDFVGTNPCGEILLQSKGMCNLTTVNLMAFVDELGNLNVDELKLAFKLSARAGYRMANIELELPQWNKVQEEDRLIGCSFTGWQDMVNATKISKTEEDTLFETLRNIVNNTANEYAKQVNKNEPKLATTIKPEGTLSLLPTVSSGIHYSHSPYYIRRIRINAHDPLVKVCEELNYPIFPEVGQDMETCTTKVIEFPVKSPEGKTKYDVSAIEQLENYRRTMNYYTDHNTSITVSVRDDEWEEVEQWIWDNWNDVLGISFLPLTDAFYQLMPYEAITKEEYELRKSTMKPFNQDLLKKYELSELIEDDSPDAECSTGACPTR